jgi:mRNA interferase MazF
VALADAGKGDWVLWQITSNAYADARAIELTPSNFASGSLRLTSYARPAKLFTANQTLLVSQAGILNEGTFQQIVKAVIALLQEAIE